MTTSASVIGLGNLSTSLLEEFNLKEVNTLFLGILYLIISVLVMISNGLVLFVMFRTKALQKPTLWVISHMAFWDFLNGFLTVLVTVPSAMLSRFAYPERYVGVTACVTTYLVSLLFLNVVTIVIDRWVCLRFPLANANVKKSRYVFAAIVLHVLAVCRMLIVSFADMDFYYNKVIAMPLSVYGNFKTSFASLGFIAAALIIIIVCSSLIVHTVRQRRRRIGQVGTHVIPRNIIKLSIMSVLSAAVFCVSFVPLMTLILWRLCVHDPKNIHNWAMQVMILCILSNSIWNVLIYAATYRPFRESLIYIFCRSYFRKMLRKKHGITSTVRNVTISRQCNLETCSGKPTVNMPCISGQLQAPTHLFLASKAKRIP